MLKNYKKIVIITGATGTIGSAVCRHLSAKKYYIVAVTRSDSRGRALMRQLDGSAACYKVLDVSKNDEIINLFEDDLFLNNELAGIVTCAGILKMGPSDQFKNKDWEQTIQTNTTGTFYIFQQAIKKMRSQSRGGVLIAVGSRWDQGAKGATAYASSKAALQGMVASLQKEFAGTTIRPILVSPGSVQSPMSSAVNRTIEKELIQPNDIAELIRYILSTPSRVIFNEITMQAYGYDLTDEYAQ